MKLRKTALSPYLKPDRLADVIAAITALSNYKFYKLDFEGWSKRISGDNKRIEHWENVLREHPEFFRINSHDNKASLVWRRQYARTYNVDTGEEETPDYLLDGSRNNRLSRRPLQASEVTALIETATRLHDRALEQHKDTRWWIPLLSAVLAFAGAILGAMIGEQWF